MCLEFNWTPLVGVMAGLVFVGRTSAAFPQPGWRASCKRRSLPRLSVSRLVRDIGRAERRPSYSAPSMSPSAPDLSCWMHRASWNALVDPDDYRPLQTVMVQLRNQGPYLFRNISTEWRDHWVWSSPRSPRRWGLVHSSSSRDLGVEGQNSRP